MPTVRNLNELYNYIKSQSNIILKTDVANVVTNEISDTIKEVEYPKYVSTADEPYIRKRDEGGLSDVRNMQVEVIDDNTIQITNERMDGSIDVAEVFATGVGYQWKQSEIYNMQPFPRDFYADTVERLHKNMKHVEAFRQGLNRLGINII